MWSDDVDDPSVNCDDCPIADWNNSGAVTVQDLFDFLAHYFTGCTGSGTPSSSCWRSADVNGVGGITVQDIFDFLTAWFGASNC